MTDQEIRLRFGELNADEMRLARAIVGWYERQIEELKKWDCFKERAVDNVMRILPELNTSPSWEDAANNVRALIDNMKADQAKLRAALTKASASLSAFLGFHAEALPLEAVRGLSELVREIQPLIKNTISTCAEPPAS